MTGNEYQRLAMRTNDYQQNVRVNAFTLNQRILGNVDSGELFNACFGLSGEVGEINDAVKKWVFHEKEINELHLKKELGDVLWYAALFCEAMQWSFDDVMQQNVEKLRDRYPEGFDVDKANNRNEGDI